MLSDEDTDDVLYGQPFASGSAHPPPPPKHTSARRRGSDSTLPGPSTPDRYAAHSSSVSSSVSRHNSASRSRHAHGHRRSATADSHHPLAHRKSRVELDDEDAMGGTRPGLHRMLSDGGGSGRPSFDSDQDDRTRRALGSPLSPTPPRVEETTVIVHEVSSTDSLPGVALRYGIALADLRRANHLWPADPIHLRKVLYIPLDKTPTARRAELLASSRANLSDDGPGSPPHNGSAALSNGEPYTTPPSSPPGHTNSHTSPGKGSGTGTIRRIPASQLSFFPPPSTSPPAAPQRARSATLPRPPPSSTQSRANGTGTSRAGALSTMFAALPRMSFESASSEENEHELGSVSVSYKSGLARRTRTAQMEPSPAMQLPARGDVKRRALPDEFRLGVEMGGCGP